MRLIRISRDEYFNAEKIIEVFGYYETDTKYHLDIFLEEDKVQELLFEDDDDATNFMENIGFSDLRYLLKNKTVKKR